MISSFSLGNEGAGNSDAHVASIEVHVCDELRSRFISGTNKLVNLVHIRSARRNIRSTF